MLHGGFTFGGDASERDQEEYGLEDTLDHWRKDGGKTEDLDRFESLLDAIFSTPAVPSPAAGREKKSSSARGSLELWYPLSCTQYDKPPTKETPESYGVDV